MEVLSVVLLRGVLEIERGQHLGDPDALQTVSSVNTHLGSRDRSLAGEEDRES